MTADADTSSAGASAAAVQSVLDVGDVVGDVAGADSVGAGSGAADDAASVESESDEEQPATSSTAAAAPARWDMVLREICIRLVQQVSATFSAYSITRCPSRSLTSRETRYACSDPRRNGTQLTVCTDDSASLVATNDQ